MSLSRRSPPKYRHFRPKNLGVVRIDGRDHYLGPYGSPESWAKYYRLVSDWLAEAPGEAEVTVVVPQPPRLPLTVAAVLLQYWEFAQRYYLKNGQPTSELHCLKAALRPVRRLYGNVLASEFGPLALKAVREAFIAQNASRSVLNKHIGRIKRMFAWAVSEELIPSGVSEGLRTVAGLRRGRSAARETAPVGPVPDAWIASVLPHLSPHVAAMVQLQRLTGMRPGEVVQLRPCDLDASGEIWIYRPASHKTEHLGRQKAIPLGPQAQVVVQPFLARGAEEFLFSPQEAEQWRIEHRPPYHGRRRKTRVFPGERQALQRRKAAREARRPRRKFAAAYSTGAYRRAIEHGIRRTARDGCQVPPWHPNQIRHTRATEIRKQHGIEAAQVVLGHAWADVTQVYAERDLDLAIKVAEQSG